MFKENTNTQFALSYLFAWQYWSFPRHISLMEVNDAKFICQGTAVCASHLFGEESDTIGHTTTYELCVVTT